MQLQDKIILKINELNVEAFTINDIIELGTYDNLRKTLERIINVKINMLKNNNINMYVFI